MRMLWAIPQHWSISLRLWSKFLSKEVCSSPLLPPCGTNWGWSWKVDLLTWANVSPVEWAASQRISPPQNELLTPVSWPNSHLDSLETVQNLESIEMSLAWLLSRHKLWYNRVSLEICMCIILVHIGSLYLLIFLMFISSWDMAWISL